MITRLEFVRRKRGMSQKELAGKIFVAQPHISQIEKGKLSLFEIKYGVVKDLEGIFGEPIEQLLAEME